MCRDCRDADTVLGDAMSLGACDTEACTACAALDSGGDVEDVAVGPGRTEWAALDKGAPLPIPPGPG